MKCKHLSARGEGGSDGLKKYVKYFVKNNDFLSNVNNN